MTGLADLKVKIFADGADLDSMTAMYRNPLIKGFTTNPTLMRKDGVTDYESFAREVIAAIPDRPVSFEVFADEADEMERQAREIASWGDNVNVKIPVTNTKGAFMGDLINRLSASGVVLNVTAIMTLDQVRWVADSLDAVTAAIVSVFAGRIADTGIDPILVMAEAVDILKDKPKKRASLGQPAGAFEHLPRRSGRLSHHHRHPRRSQETGSGREEPGRLFPRHRQDVLQRRRKRRV